MSRRAVVTITCDFCAAEQAPETFAVETIVVRYNGDAPRAVDVCEEHAAVWASVRAVLRTRGVAPGAEAATSTERSDRFGVVTCKVCGQECRGGTGLAAHTRARHGASVAA